MTLYQCRVPYGCVVNWRIQRSYEDRYHLNVSPTDLTNNRETNALQLIFSFPFSFYSSQLEDHSEFSLFLDGGYVSFPTTLPRSVNSIFQDKYSCIITFTRAFVFLFFVSYFDKSFSL